MKTSRIIEALSRAAEAEGDVRASAALAHFARSSAMPKMSASDEAALRAFAKKAFGTLVSLATTTDDPALRHAVAWALGQSGRPAAVGPLFRMLTHQRDWFDHDYAFAALAALGDAALLELDKRALSGDLPTAGLAVAAMAQGRGDVFGHLERVRKKRKRLPDGFYRAYRNVGDARTLDVVFGALGDRVHARDALESAEEVLCSIGYGRATKQQRRAWAAKLRPLVDAADVNVRAQALVCIGRLGDDTELARVIAALDADEDDVVAAAAGALSHIATAEALAALDGALASRRAVVRSTAAATLLAQGGARGAKKKRAIATLVDAVSALPDKWARERAILTLCQVRGGEAALCASMDALSAPQQKRAAEALVEMAYLCARPETAHDRMRGLLRATARRAFDAAWARRTREERAIARELERVRASETPRSKPPSSDDVPAQTAERAPRKKRARAPKKKPLVPMRTKRAPKPPKRAPKAATRAPKKTGRRR